MASRKGAAIDNTPAASANDALVAILNNEGTQVNTSDNPMLAAPAAIAPAVDNTPVLTTPAIEAARASIAAIEAAQALLTNAPAAAAVLAEQLDTARGALALAEADAALDAEKAAAIASARSAATAAKLPDSVLAAMLTAIEAQYAYVPRDPANDVVAAPPAAYVGRKQVSARTAERNAAALAIMAADASVGTRVADTYAAFGKDWASDLRGVAAVAGTRYASIVAFAGAGVANASDYRALVPQIRQHLLAIGLQEGGATYASDPWLFAFGPHGAGGPKQADSLTLKFRSGAAIALHADGRFRLTLRNTPNVRFVHADAAALAAWNGSTAPQAASAPTTPNTPAAPAASAPRVPTAPSVQAAPNGALTSTARCQHCTARNFTTNTECSACGASDWQAAA